MFVPSDGISEVIAHFIGYFELRVEEMRLRLVYQEFEHRAAVQPIEDLPFVPTRFVQHLELSQYIPGVDYVANLKPFHIHSAHLSHHGENFHLSVPQMRWSGHDEADGDASGYLAGFRGFGHITSWGEVEPTPGIGPDPYSTILVANQIMGLDDNDTVVFGNTDFVPTSIVDHLKFDMLVSQAEAISAPLTGLEAPNSETQIPQFFHAVTEVMHTLAEQPVQDGVTVLSGDAVSGIHIDGLSADETPSLQDALPLKLQAEVADAEPAPVTSQSLSITPEGGEAGSVTLESGGNLLVNQATLVNAGLASTFLAVAGDYHEINLVIQTNVYSDNDTIDAGFPGAAANVASTTMALNVANFAQEVHHNAESAAAAHQDAMPANWQVSVVTGNMVFMQWIVQYNLTSDNDTHVLTSTGTTTTITTGENVGLNGVAFTDIGHYFDLVIVGGNLFDGNIISQTNVLYDDDTLQMLSDPAGVHGSASTSGNLLWNSASILNVGATDWQAGLPQSYTDAMSALKAGDNHMPDSFKSDGAFQGFYGLKVLYVEGDIYDLRYVNQVNVLGDADHVAIYEQQLTGANAATDWAISTGSNALVNAATIVDFDSLGDKAYIGGQIYSDAILIQANLVDGDHAPDASSGGPLVSEVIAFLDNDGDAIPHTHDDSTGAGHMVSDGPPADIMQSVLA